MLIPVTFGALAHLYVLWEILATRRAVIEHDRAVRRQADSTVLSDCFEFYQQEHRKRR